MTRFEIRIPDRQLSDLERRLALTRLDRAPAARPWESGVSYEYLADLVAYWRDRFDWRRQEAWLNSFPHHQADLEGNLVHFVRVKPDPQTHPRPIPLVLSHGWPYSFVEFLPIVPLLVDPPGGGTAFDVVIPSLPGFGFSSALDGPFTSDIVARLWHRLMTEVLGHEKFVTYGEDVGCGISDWLGALYPDDVIAVFATHAAFPPDERRQDLTEAETRFLEWLDEKWKTGKGYAHIQGTRPDTLAVGLNDSPSALLAWLLEKFYEWSGPGFEEAWNFDDILTTVSLYWFTGTIGTSFLPYYHGPLEPPLPEIDVPVGVSVQWGERGFPREYAERTYLDIRVWKELPRGGHFTAKQTPGLVADDLRTFVDSL